MNKIIPTILVLFVAIGGLIGGVLEYMAALVIGLYYVLIAFPDIDKTDYKNVKIWLRELWDRDAFFRSFFITRNALGGFSINSHIRYDNGQAKQTYNHLETAKKSAEKLSIKKGIHFNYYKCLFCGGYHIGKPLYGKVYYDIKNVDKEKEQIS